MLNLAASLRNNELMLTLLLSIHNVMMVVRKTIPRTTAMMILVLLFYVLYMNNKTTRAKVTSKHMTMTTLGVYFKPHCTIINKRMESSREAPSESTSMLNDLKKRSLSSNLAMSISLSLAA